MADHRFFIGRAAHVEFETIAAVGQGLIERGDRVFRNRLEGTGAPVAKKKRTAHIRASQAANQRVRISWCKLAGANQSRSKSRIGLPVSGVSFAFLIAS